ncbi:DUF3021 family protein [Streptococcus rifensis]
MTNKHKSIRDMIISILFGIAFGHIVSLISFGIYGLTSIPLIKLVVVSIVSGLIGLVSNILFGVKEIPAKVSYPLHFIAVFTLIIIMNVFNGWVDKDTFANYALNLFLQFLIVYGVIWCIVIYLNHQKVSKINERIKQRKHELR